MDRRKAFDSIRHWAVIEAGRAASVCTRATNFVRAFLRDHTFTLVVPGGDEGRRHDNRVGTPHGSILSPLLFNMVLADLAHRLTDVTDFRFTVYADEADEVPEEDLATDIGYGESLPPQGGYAAVASENAVIYTLRRLLG